MFIINKLALLWWMRRSALIWDIPWDIPEN